MPFFPLSFDHRPLNRGPAGTGSVRHRFWLTDFAWDNGQLLIRKTGIRISVTWTVIHEIANWAIYLLILKGISLTTRLRQAERKSICFTPDRPRAWYLIRGAAIWTGIDIAGSPAEADAIAYFDDSTVGTPPSVSHARLLNFGCTDIRKSHVAHVFEGVFGYPLSLDPTISVGEIIEKPEKNGVHGGRIVLAPIERKAGYTYQRLVDTQDSNGCCCDLRTLCAGGEPVLVWIKTKTPEGRFSINNRKAILRDPGDVYAADERLKISAFCKRMGLDWGGLDILRDRADGRIYIVDVNKTDLGPVIALSWRDKITSMAKLSKALSRLIETENTR